MLRGSYKTAASNSSNIFGILYAEDFDEPSQPVDDPPCEPASEPPTPAITQADVDMACAAAVRAARVDWKLEEEQMRLKAITSLGQILSSSHNDAEQHATTVTEATVATILSVVTGLLPHFCREHGAAETRALLGRLLPVIRSRTRINVRVHPDLVAVIQRDVAELEPDVAAMIDVSAAPLERGDVKVNWENGSMARDSQKIIRAVEDALAQLGLQQPVEAPSKKRMAYAE